MFRSGAFVAEHVTPLDGDQVQPNGVDLTLESAFEQREPGFIGKDGKSVGARQHRLGGPPHTESSDDGGGSESSGEREGTYYLPRGGYVVRYGEVVEIPQSHVGFIYPRSTLLRNSCMLNTAVWDAGYEGKGEGLLQVHHDIEIEAGARIAQIVLARADHEETYEGSYQGENVD